MKKIILIVAGVLVAAGLGLLWCKATVGLHQGADRNGGAPGFVNSGERHGADQAQDYANLGATAMGRVTNLTVKEGDHVKKGQIVATIGTCSSTRW